jgi:hypothetical protein
MRLHDLFSDNDNLPGNLDSLAGFLSDPMPTHERYQEGDVLKYKGERCTVVKANKLNVLVQKKSGPQIIKRNDPDLDVAQFEEW